MVYCYFIIRSYHPNVDHPINFHLLDFNLRYLSRLSSSLTFKFFLYTIQMPMNKRQTKANNNKHSNAILLSSWLWSKWLNYLFTEPIWDIEVYFGCLAGWVWLSQHEHCFKNYGEMERIYVWKGLMWEGDRVCVKEREWAIPNLFIDETR